MLTVPVRAPDARTALAAAQATATDLLMVLASKFSGYGLVVDERQLTRRTAAVYQAESPPPPFDVAEGGISEAGAAEFDPTGELRRAGKVLTFRATAVVTHPPAEDVRRFAGRAAWSARLRSGLRLFHAAQNARDEIVEFTLTAAAMEVLADADEAPLLDKLDDTERARMRAELDALLGGFDLADEERDRLGNRLLDTRAAGSAQAIRDYLRRHGAVTELGDLRWWQRQRGRYLHDGSFDDDPQRRYRLRHAIGTCLASELDERASTSSAPSD
ncbi:MAG: hypothetical protein M3Z25_13515 [Actinomycetota bacterium]|nr:hypothetical protein [Actinomycetota bacterium]